MAAEKELRTSTRIGGSHWETWNYLGIVLWHLGDTDEAAVALQRAVAVSPRGISKPREDLSALLISRGRADEAIQAS